MISNYYAYASLLNLFEKFAELTDIEEEILIDSFTISYYPAKTFFIKSETTNIKLGFLASGSAINLCKINDVAIINKFYLDNSIICNVHSFISQTEHDTDIQFNEPSFVLEMDYDTYQTIKPIIPKMEKIIYELQNEELVFYKNRSQTLQTKDAKSRLEELIVYNKNILKRFKSNDIATYLGIKGETLSRLKLMFK